MEEMTPEEFENYKLHRRFDRMGRLIGDLKMKKLMDSSVMIIGLGGVGSWAAESLVRSGIGRVTLVDFDDICITNTNRQLQALAHNTGKPKAEILAARMREINPNAEITSVVQFYNEESSASLLKPASGLAHDFVIDAIDNVTAKCHLLNECRILGIPVVCSTGAGGRLDPTKIQVKDLSETEKDPLAKALRRILRQQFDFPDNGRFNIPAVYSTEEAREPIELHYDGGNGFRCLCPHKDKNTFFQCEKRNVILGNSSFVTATFGTVCASVVVRALIGEFDIQEQQ